MTKQQFASQPAIAVFPYLSLRQAVRPAIFAYSMLAQEQERAGMLVSEANNLLQATRELLKAAGLVHLLTPVPRDETADTDGDDQRAQLLDAYANAGMLWAQVVGSSLTLADALLGRERWDEAGRLADFLHDAGEVNTAENLRKRAHDACRQEYYRRLARIHDDMSEQEISTAIDTLRNLPDDFPNRDNEIGHRIKPMARSMYKVYERAKVAVPQVISGLIDPSYLATPAGWFYLNELATVYSVRPHQ